MPILSTPAVSVNGIPISVVANSVEYTEGLGEQDFKTSSTGGRNVQQTPVDNIEKKFSMVKFSVLSEYKNLELVKQWKIAFNNNKVVISDFDLLTGQSFSRTFLNAMLSNDYEVNLKSDGVIDVEFKAQSAI